MVAPPRMLSAVCVALALMAGCSGRKSGSSAFDFGSGLDATTPTEAGPPLLTTSGYAGPTTCDEAASQRSYIGCDYWPTVTTNPVWSVFDFTAVVANAQSGPATVTVTGPNGVDQTTTVAGGALEKIYLPWVPALKGPDCDQCGQVPLFAESVLALGSAYHLVSSVPVTVYQFNALEYKGVGGPPGKDWSSCPGSSEICIPPDAGGWQGYAGCFSYTNDASLLIPSTAMTGNYRVTGEHASRAIEGSYFAITAVQDSTHVTVTVASTGSIVGGGGVTATAANGTLKLTMNAGDVVELMSDMLSDSTDLSGSLVQADHSIQIIAGTQCSEEPEGHAACDHLESSLLPAETLGSDYVVTVPTSPGGRPIGHVVRFYGNADDTTLVYSPSRPSGCPPTLNASQVVECSGIVTTSFEVKGTHEFAVSSFQLGGSIIAEHTRMSTADGDPSMSPMVAVEQYRQNYLFLAPGDYDQSFMDVVAQPGTILILDGKKVTNTPTTINKSWMVTRVQLLADKGGSHVLAASTAVGVQVEGYGAYTSYQYPAGLDLAEISPPPVLK